LTNEMINTITQGDCLEVMRDIPSNSVDLIVIDPPYNIGKDKRWDKYETIDAYVEFMSEVFTECERVLKDNGSFYWFHNDMTQIRKLMDVIDERTDFVYKQFIVWNKRYEGAKLKGYLDGHVAVKELRNYKLMAEYCLFYTFEEYSAIHEKRMTTNNINMFSPYVEKIRNDVRNSGLTMEQASELFDREGRFSSKESARVRASYQLCFTKGKYFELLTESMYDYLSDYISWTYSYKELKDEYENIKKQLKQDAEDILRKRRYTFNNQRTHHSVWNYDVAPKIGHTTPKPVELIENIIRHSSNEGDIVLDCFLGSGTSAVAAINTGRNFIGIEKEPEYVEIARQRVDEALANKNEKETINI